MSSDEERKVIEGPAAPEVEHENEQGSGENLSTIRITLVLVSLYGISAAASLGTGLVMIGSLRLPEISHYETVCCYGKYHTKAEEELDTYGMDVFPGQAQPTRTSPILSKNIRLKSTR